MWLSQPFSELQKQGEIMGNRKFGLGGTMTSDDRRLIVETLGEMY